MICINIIVIDVKNISLEWNLKRHKTDVHQEVENAKNDNINQEFKENLNHMHCNDNYSTYPFYTEHNNIKSFPNSYTASHISEIRIFTVDDKLRIQKN